jgi:rhamnogalacturonan hydrolase
MIADILPLLVFATGLVQAQLTGLVGPTTPLSSKSNICNILDYGGCADGKDIGPAITDAFYVRAITLSPCLLTKISSHNQNCVKKTPGSTLYVPEG